MVATSSRCQIRPMSLNDIPAVEEIDREAFPTMWPPTSFKRELQHNHLARYLVAVERPPIVSPAEDSSSPFLGWLFQLLHRKDAPSPQELIVGFVGLWLMVDEGHIVSIAVRESHRRRGIGELLLIATIDLAVVEDLSVITLECRVSNYAAQALYEKYGFRRAGIRPRYYSDNGEDAYVMTTDPIHTASYQAMFQCLKEDHRRRWPELYGPGDE